ncbi:uncharacterized protein EI97DRAFT_468667 [Westerdykella ornata]|uniref:NACHT domain-containing protein n=1 Tax=Westerdykella ornata TaxID=318751 RepID=A0A6A6JE35_WESOR|nr:uncharacterized protein EI97DRAFT_468667 [Westerdykella ornata]KAF2274474.1 hypothetical protein EI97DRAFT_468667 [Westerdykella ornata]
MAFQLPTAYSGPPKTSKNSIFAANLPSRKSACVSRSSKAATIRYTSRDHRNYSQRRDQEASEGALVEERKRGQQDLEDAKGLYGGSQETIKALSKEFVDFTVRVILQGREIKKDGASVHVVAIVKRTEELKSWIEFLKVPIDRRDAALKAEYEALDSVVTGCTEVADEIVKLLDKNRPYNGRTYNIEELTQTLKYHRHELSLHLLALMNAKHDLQSSHLDDRLNDLNKTQSRIVEILNFTQSRSNATKHVSGELVRERAPLKQEEIAPRRNIERVITFRESRDSTDETVSNHQVSTLSKVVLGSLYFRMMRMRVEATSEAHSGTFSWIFQPPKDGKWSDFARWLRQGNGVYWITGKPGSDKSTPMKHILQDPKRDELLNEWKGRDALVKVEFFFWASGTTIQKSLEGLLRALLYSLLEQCADMILSAFPSVCKEIMAGSQWGGLGLPPRSSELTLAELDMAIRLLVEKSKRLKFCLFIDGLDEYSGAQDKIIQTFQKLASHPHVKIIISSRPCVIFQDAFHNKPRLRVQDLTYADIEKYISDSLSSSRGLQEMKRINAELDTTLVQAVCQKSQGVFLWVILAVRSLLDGLMNGDKVSMLHDRIEQLPSDLQEMYTGMFDATSPSMRAATARTMLLIMRNQEVPKAEPVTLLKLALVEELEMTKEKIISHPVQTIPESHRRSLCQTMTRRINGRTKGLLEVYGTNDAALRGSSPSKGYVGFFHRTAIDFFRDSAMWNKLIMLAGSTFDADITLLLACLCEMKILPPKDSSTMDADHIVNGMTQCLVYASFIEDRHLRAFPSVLDEVEQTMKTHWHWQREKSKQAESFWDVFLMLSQFEPISSVSSWYRPYLGHSFLFLAISRNCVLYAAEKASLHDEVSEELRALMVITIISDNFMPYLPVSNEAKWDRMDESSIIVAITKVLETDRRAPKPMDLGSCWRDYLSLVDGHAQSSVLRPPRYVNGVLQILGLFLESGVDPDIMVTSYPGYDNLKVPSVSKSAQTIVANFLAAVKSAMNGALDHDPQAENDFDTMCEKIQFLLNTASRDPRPDPSKPSEMANPPKPRKRFTRLRKFLHFF